MEEQYVIIPDDIFSKDQKEPCVSPAENLKLASPLASPRVKKVLKKVLIFHFILINVQLLFVTLSF